ncbi:hypothetical protein Tco_0842422 [Tanacetum coccineum]|uniref:Uncharacterized protein n=1 Tax=Tanacetum coccineum TaxID=301880 RepID=A0ABQ5AZS4_9ASTR
MLRVIGEGVSLEVGGEDLGFNSNEEEVVPKVDYVSLVDRVFDSAFGGDGEEDVVMGEGVPWKDLILKEIDDDKKNGEDKWCLGFRVFTWTSHGNWEFPSPSPSVRMPPVMNNNALGLGTMYSLFEVIGGMHHQLGRSKVVLCLINFNPELLKDNCLMKGFKQVESWVLLNQLCRVLLSCCLQNHLDERPNIHSLPLKLGVECPPYLSHSLHPALYIVIWKICSECSDSGSDLCIKESATTSLVSVICHPVKVRAGCCLEADASDSLGFIELWSSAFGGGLADPEAAESYLLLFVDLPWFDPAEGPSSSSSSSSSSLSCFLLWSFTLSATSLSMASSSAIKRPISILSRSTLLLKLMEVRNSSSMGSGLVHQETHVILQSHESSSGLYFMAPGTQRFRFQFLFLFESVVDEDFMDHLLYVSSSGREEDRSGNGLLVLHSNLRPFPFPNYFMQGWGVAFDLWIPDCYSFQQVPELMWQNAGSIPDWRTGSSSSL